MLELNKTYFIKEIDNLKDFVTVAYVQLRIITKRLLQHPLKNSVISIILK